MKKVLSLLMAVLVCVASAIPVWADDADSALVERLILAAKEKLPIDDDEVTFRNYYTTGDDGDVSYSLYWQSEDEQNYKNIYVGLDPDGTIRSYNLYETGVDFAPAFAMHTKAEAIEAAKAFVTSIDPVRLAETEEPTATLDHDRNYTVTFQRVHNGIPVEDELLRCVIRDDDLQVTDYDSPWSELTFADEALITEEQAQTIFAEQLGYRLFYQISSENYENTVKLVYRSRYDESVAIDAVTGEAIPYPEVAPLRNNLKGETAMDSAATSGGSGGAQLSAVERELVEKVAAMLSKEKADTICRAVSEFRITNDYRLEQYTTYRSENGKYVIQLRYRRPEQEDGTGYGYINVSLEAENGRVVGYYASEYKDDAQWQKKQSLTRESLQAKAEQFLEKYYADTYAQMAEKAHFTTPEGSGFEYLRLVGDIPVYDNGVWMSFDEKTGQLTAFQLNWTETEFPEVTAAEQSAADKAAMAEGKFGLRYVAAAEAEGKATQAKAIYALEQTPVLDAATLVPLDYNLQPKADTETPNYGDIEGFYGAAQIQKLLDNNLYLPAAADGNLHPYEAVTQETYLRFLTRCIDGYDEYDSDYLYRRMIRRGVLTAEERNPDAPITRYEGIAYLIRMLGYGDFVKIPDIFRCPFNDIVPEQSGVAAVARGLKLVSGDGGSLYPNMPLRRGDAMIIMHNYLKH